MWSILFGALLALIACGCFGWLIVPAFAGMRRRRLAQPTVDVHPAPVESAVSDLNGSRGGWLRVGTAAELLRAVHAGATIDHLRRQSKLAPSVFERDLLPAIEQYAEFVQLFPASESHHHAHAGGLLAHTLESLLIAVTWRNGVLLPHGAQAEAIDAERDFWTYVVFFAALLHDIGKPLTDLRVEWTRARALSPVRWVPQAGSLVACGGHEYKVGFAPKSERDYSAHQRLAITLLQRIAPATALSFLSREPKAMDALVAFLSGEDKNGSVAELVRKADQRSTAHSLAHGSRARFTSASSVPLVELLMDGLRQLLNEGTQLPLNRSGAAGWVFDGSLWLVAKRAADTVRAHLQRVAPEEGIPGESKNDRLFDTWQEYRCILPNPQTGQSVWYVVVHGADGEGYSHALTMLRFPLSKIWADEGQYPAEMRGRIEIKASRSSTKSELNDDHAETASEEPVAQAVSDAVEAGTAASKARSAPKTPVPGVRAPTFASKTVQSGRPPATTSAPAPAKAPAPPPVEKEATALLPAYDSNPELLPAVSALPTEDAFLDDDDSAVAEAKASRRPAAKSTRETGHAVLSPRTPTGDKVAALVKAEQEKGSPTDLANRFMRWLLEGLNEGSLKFNEAGASVHFVDLGMALVSPKIFRDFALAAGLESVDPARLGLDVQRDVLKAGWHVPAGNQNIHAFQVTKKGTVKAGRLSAVVLADPHRWVVPVPPSNPALVPEGTITLAGSTERAT